MRTETITRNLFTFDELSDKAKEVARDWWRECEAQDPAWVNEHSDSLRAALEFVRSYRYSHTIEDLYATAKAWRSENTPDSRCCPWTGYCADETAIDAILEACADGVEDLDTLEGLVDDAMSKAWEDEQEYAMLAENVDENIRANGYEFTESGKIA